MSEVRHCMHCRVMVRKDPPTGEWWHVVEVPGSSRTSATYRHCRLQVAEPGPAMATVDGREIDDLELRSVHVEASEAGRRLETSAGVPGRRETGVPLNREDQGLV